MNAWVVIGSASGLAGAIVAVFALWHSTRRESAEDRTRAMAQAISSGLAPVSARMDLLDARIVGNNDKITDLVNADSRMADRLGTVISRVEVLDTKMEVFWKSVALDAAKILHSPNPARRHVDELLEELMNGTITATRKRELRGILEHVRDYHPGDPSDFPIYPGERVAAAILLRTMEYVGK